MSKNGNQTRKKRTPEEKAEIVKLIAAAPGRERKAVAKRLGVGMSHYYYWANGKRLGHVGERHGAKDAGNVVKLRTPEQKRAIVETMNAAAPGERRAVAKRLGVNLPTYYKWRQGRDMGVRGTHNNGASPQKRRPPKPNGAATPTFEMELEALRVLVKLARRQGFLAGIMED